MSKVLASNTIAALQNLVNRLKKRCSEVKGDSDELWRLRHCAETILTVGLDMERIAFEREKHGKD